MVEAFFVPHFVAPVKICKLMLRSVNVPYFHLIRGSVNGGFQTVVRVSSGEHIAAPPYNFNLTSSLLREKLKGNNN